jgi:hypothetical protein
LKKTERTSSLCNSPKSMVYLALFTALITVGAFIRIPVPVCPFTLQLFFTTLAGLLLGSRRGAAAIAVYVALGLAGIPGLHGRRRPFLHFSADLRLSGRFYCRNLADRQAQRNSRSSIPIQAVGGRIFRTRYRIYLWHKLCIYH